MDPGQFGISCSKGGHSDTVLGLSGCALHCLDVGVHCPKEDSVARQARAAA